MFLLSIQHTEILKNFSDKIQLKKYSSHTLKTYQSCFTIFLLYCEHVKKEVDTITKEGIEDFMLHWKKKKYPSAAHQNQMINSIKFYYEQVLGRPKEFYILTRAKKPKLLPKVISKKEVAELIKNIENVKHKAIVSLIYALGLKIGELLKLTLNDIQTDRGIIAIKGGKGKKDRIIMLSSKMLILLRQYFKVYKPKFYLFEGVTHQRYSSTSVNRIIKNAARKAKISTDLTAYTLRHSFVAHLLEQGKDIRYIQELLGHGSSKTTKRYAHVTMRGFENLKSPFDNLHIDKEANAHSKTKGEAKHSKRENINQK